MTKLEIELRKCKQSDDEENRKMRLLWKATREKKVTFKEFVKMTDLIKSWGKDDATAFFDWDLPF